MAGRLRWFGRLRWVAAAALALGPLFSGFFGLPESGLALTGIGALVALYNLAFLLALRRASAHGYAHLRTLAIAEMVFDLVALSAALHFTGGLSSPLLIFLTFHMAIGSIMLAPQVMAVIAAVTSVLLMALWYLESSNLLPGVGNAAGGSPERAAAMAMAAVLGMFGIVYLTASVTARFKRRSLALYARSQKLRERTEAQAQLIEEIRAVEQRKSHYMQISAHQLRSPLGTIKSALEVVLEGVVDPGSERGRRLLAGAAERTDGLLETVSKLLELAKIREGRRKAPWRRSVDLGALVGCTVGRLEPLARERSVSLEMSVEAGLGLDWGVAPDLEVAVENLVHNAIVYSHPGSAVQVSLTRRGEDACLEVVDRGIGIPEDLLQDVFLEFVRAPNAKKHAPQGSGLGLAIVREVAATHGGTLSVISRAEEGSSFAMTLPTHHTPSEVTAALPNPPPERYAGPTGPSKANPRAR